MVFHIEKKNSTELSWAWCSAHSTQTPYPLEFHLKMHGPNHASRTTMHKFRGATPIAVSCHAVLCPMPLLLRPRKLSPSICLPPVREHPTLLHPTYLPVWRGVLLRLNIPRPGTVPAIKQVFNKYPLDWGMNTSMMHIPNAGLAVQAWAQIWGKYIS